MFSNVAQQFVGMWTVPKYGPTVIEVVDDYTVLTRDPKTTRSKTAKVSAPRNIHIVYGRTPWDGELSLDGNTIQWVQKRTGKRSAWTKIVNNSSSPTDNLKSSAAQTVEPKAASTSAKAVQRNAGDSSPSSNVGTTKPKPSVAKYVAPGYRNRQQQPRRFT